MKHHHYMKSIYSNSTDDKFLDNEVKAILNDCKDKNKKEKPKKHATETINLLSLLNLVLGRALGMSGTK